MRIVHTEFYILTVFISSIESISSAGVSPASSTRRERTHSSSSSYGDPLISLPSPDGSECDLDQIEFIRLTPVRNLHQQFELRRYTFPGDEGLKLVVGHNVFLPVSPQEQIVLSTSDDDVFAILSNSDYLAGIYRHIQNMRDYKRIKINMKSGWITPLTLSEVKEVPVGHVHQIKYNFRVDHLNQSYVSRSHAALPFSEVLGYRLDQLEFIRLCYKGNPHRLFELRRYTFPADKLIKIVAERHRYRPISIQERIVLSTCGGEVFAIFQSGQFFAGIYSYDPRTQNERRAKMNMGSGRIDLMTSDEIQEVPVGPSHQIKMYYIVDLIN